MPAEAAPRAQDASPSPRFWLFLFAVFAVGGLGVFRVALSGPFVSDDVLYINNPYVLTPSLENLLEILDPFSQARLLTGNYAPAHQLFIALEWKLFGPDVLGYHVVNLVTHVLNSVMLVALLLSSGVPRRWAILGAALFAYHPANVEAVAWISQSKTLLALACSLGALLALRGRPALGTALFALGLLFKPLALFALPMAAALTWARRGRPGGGARHRYWLGAWTALFLLYAVPQLVSFAEVGQVAEGHMDPWVQARTIAAIGMRYLVMAATSYGVSAFHEPAPATSPLDPWWLASLPAGLLLGWRTIVTLRARQEEAGYWLGAVAGFAPVSQVFPFPYSMGDRYLYFILPGLIGGALLWGGELHDRLRAWLAAREQAPRLGDLIGKVTGGAAVALLVFFALHAAGRARLWQQELLLLADAAKHYPQGSFAYYMEALRAIEGRDPDAAVVALRGFVARSPQTQILPLLTNPPLAPIVNTPAFRGFIYDLAGERIEEARRRGLRTQWHLRSVAEAHVVRGEFGEAEKVLEEAIEIGGPYTTTIRSELEAVRVMRDRRSGSGRGGGDSPE